MYVTNTKGTTPHRATDARTNVSERTTRLERGKGKGRTFGSLLDGLVGLDVAGHGDAAEEGADEERGDLEHGQKRGPAGAGVVDEQPLWDFWPKRTKDPQNSLFLKWCMMNFRKSTVIQ